MEYLAAAEDDGLRLGTVCRRSMLVSHSRLQHAKWNGLLLLNGQAARTDQLVRRGDRITLLEESIRPAYLPKPYPLPLRVVYQDQWLAVVDKPAPLASQSGKNHPDDSLENAFFSHLGCPEDFVYRPVNRLDKGTSGLMAIALNAHTQQLMQRRLHSASFRRIYLAVTDGTPPEERGIISLPIRKEDSVSIRRVAAEDGKPSVTRYQVLQTTGNRALVRLELETGRTHQIRVHLSCLGCPVFGDFLYGTERTELPGRFALHSSELMLTHPHTGEELHFSSLLPPELLALLQ